jgi:hypothetical protein
MVDRKQRCSSSLGVLLLMTAEIALQTEDRSSSYLLALLDPSNSIRLK